MEGRQLHLSSPPVAAQGLQRFCARRDAAPLLPPGPALRRACDAAVMVLKEAVAAAPQIIRSHGMAAALR